MLVQVLAARRPAAIGQGVSVICASGWWQRWRRSGLPGGGRVFDVAPRTAGRSVAALSGRGRPYGANDGRCCEDCRSGLTIRTSKCGQYAYHTCTAKATAGAGRCGGRPIRQDALDAVVLDTLLERVLQAERLKLLLAQVLEWSDETDQRRRSDLTRVQRGCVAAQTRCLVPRCGVTHEHHEARQALWDRFYTAAPARRTRSVERYSGVKRA